MKLLLQKRKAGTKKTKAKEKDKEREKVPITAMLDQLPPEEAAQKEKPTRRTLTPPKILSFSTETSAEIRSALDQWMKSIAHPQELHLELITQYLYFQIENRNLELAQKVLGWMRSIASEEEGDSCWRVPFNLVLEKIQSVLLEKYAARIAVSSLLDSQTEVVSQKKRLEFFFLLTM